MDVNELGTINLRDSIYIPNFGSRLNFDIGPQTPQANNNMNGLFGAPKQTSSILNMQLYM